MSAADMRPWSLSDFFAWQERQDARYELVGGFPVKMMTGASNRHDDIVVNILGELRARLRGKSCRPFTADGAVETFPGQIRRPDAGIDCGKREPDAYVAAKPTVVFEVLSPSTREFDRIQKLEEYRSLPGLRHIVIVEPKRLAVLHLSRMANDGPWVSEALGLRSDVIHLAAVDIELPLDEIYAGMVDGGGENSDLEREKP